jgi:hypothetical protein
MKVRKTRKEGKKNEENGITEKGGSMQLLTGSSAASRSFSWLKTAALYVEWVQKRMMEACGYH